MAALAFNRRIRAFEAGFGSAIFQRLPGGMKLQSCAKVVASPDPPAKAGSNTRPWSSGGPVKIACSQARPRSFLPREISKDRAEFADVTSSVNLRDGIPAEQDLVTFERDPALGFDPAPETDTFDRVRHVAAHGHGNGFQIPQAGMLLPDRTCPSFQSPSGSVQEEASALDTSRGVPCQQPR